MKKIGEESTEVIIAAKAEDKKETIYEIADLAYHVMVLMVQAGISLEDVKKELAKSCSMPQKISICPAYFSRRAYTSAIYFCTSSLLMQ